jgi:hypothetical protein
MGLGPAARRENLEEFSTMTSFSRRDLLSGSAAAGFVAATRPLSAFAGSNDLSPALRKVSSESSNEVDFRYAPAQYQTAFCFPDDHHKSLVNERGNLLYDFPDNQFASIDQFGTVVEFTLGGMDRDTVRRQWIESPSIPIVHTLIERPAASFELIAFATDRPGEGRVDNVLLEVRAKQNLVQAAPRLNIQCSGTCELAPGDSRYPVLTRADKKTWIYCMGANPSKHEAVLWSRTGGYELLLEHLTSTPEQPARYLFRIQLDDGARTIDRAFDPDALLTSARSFWQSWKPYGGAIQFDLSGANGDFLRGCARNIQQVRENKDGHLVFQVGPTVYRGLWIVDGNFLLEAARYLGYDKEADDGLRSEWSRQAPTGQIIAGGGGEHWKDTAIAMFTLVRACELKDDWAMLRELREQVTLGIRFLIKLRDEARRGSSPNGRYGLLAPGFPDGGIGDVHSEFSNTLWVLAGLRAVMRCNESLKIPDLNIAASFYRELRGAFDEAAKQEMVADPRGFSYLPILMRDDPDWKLPDPWQRPRPQTAQWPVSHAIFPGSIFGKDDPIVKGHIALMQACTAEDVPAETGWLRHESLWTYNAPFVAQVYLWAGLRDWAERTFTGFLNHASPLLAWREEQPLQQASVSQFWGDMPHNWASAECIRYLRHRLVLEDEDRLRLLDGILPSEFARRKAFSLEGTPTRFGRVSLAVEPAGKQGWQISFRREGSRAPRTVELAADLLSSRTPRLEGAGYRLSGGRLLIEPEKTEWKLSWS